MTTKPKRQLFFRDYQVLRARGRVYGKKLPANQVLVKLRASGQPPKWELLERDEYDREKYFRAVRYQD